ncbi:MAG: hypothetical protein IKL21_00865 [Clostridia bacterium]|jgi:hypothetical protein|nr:hypothetical protein [Clostridia bacterium]
MRKCLYKCNEKVKTVTLCAVSFGAGVLLSVFLPPVFMVIIEAVLVCGVGILFII